VRRPLEARIYRRAGRDEQRFQNIFEFVPQTFVLPLADFAAASPDFKPERLRSIRLRFDRAFRGAIILDDVGINPSMDPSWLAAPLKP